ncbi:hypothetical protein D9V41_06450 [Aeromicrobium phragmitis]|uniref:Uncharacterized protein n=1 Tax=Aeromicrobium phragmitis TaxID=2478914 RepID=A0A3L8PPE5_9ACTN|nr:hypothetical protein [Aeromicrobium phragmitis]RLV56699.1 hypothetical protein D9V41_06450 [Aeromicrobium phragmitis]
MKRYAGAFGVLAAWWLLPWLVVLVLRSQAATVNADGQCSGIGFGCSLTPYDGYTFAMVFFLAPLTLVAVLSAALWLALRRRPLRPVRDGSVAALIGIACAAAGGLVVAAFGFAS